MHHRLNIKTAKLNQITGELFFEPAGHPWIRYSLTPWDKGLTLSCDTHPFNPAYDDCPDLFWLLRCIKKMVFKFGRDVPGKLFSRSLEAYSLTDDNVPD